MKRGKKSNKAFSIGKKAMRPKNKNRKHESAVSVRKKEIINDISGYFSEYQGDPVSYKEVAATLGYSGMTAIYVNSYRYRHIFNNKFVDCFHT